MNPQTAAPTMSRPMVNDIASPARRPAPQAAPAPRLQLQAQPQHVPAAVTPPAPVVPLSVPAQPATQTSSTLTTSLVANIPVHAPQGAGASASEDDELDKIMKDVGRELKKDDQKKNKSHFSLFHKQKAASPATVLPAAPNAASHPVQAAAAVQPIAAPQPAVQPQPQVSQPKAAARPKRESSAPILPITMAVIVTGLLMAAAIYTYK